MFLFFSVIYLFFLFSSSWAGGPLVLGGAPAFALLVLSAAVLVFVYFSEARPSVAFLVALLCLLVSFFVLAGSLLSFYLLLELSLLPLLLLLLSYGAQPQKVGASVYLIFYGVLSSVPLLWVLLSSNIYCFYSFSPEGPLDSFVLFLLLSGFLMKLPAYLFHSWLPRVHVESPTSASVVLAAILLKMGAWGLFRVLPSLAWSSSFLWVWLAFLGMLLAPLVCLLSSDFKSLAAYSSVVHMGFFFCVLLSLSLAGASAGFLVLVGHGYVSALIFWLVGELYRCLGVRLIFLSGGLWSSMLSFSVVLASVFLFNSGVPPSCNFFAEVAGLSSVFLTSFGWVAFLGFYYFVGLVYSVLLVTSLLSGSRGATASTPLAASLPFLVMACLCSFGF